MYHGNLCGYIPFPSLNEKYSFLILKGNRISNFRFPIRIFFGNCTKQEQIIFEFISREPLCEDKRVSAATKYFYWLYQGFIPFQIFSALVLGGFSCLALLYANCELCLTTSLLVKPKFKEWLFLTKLYHLCSITLDISMESSRRILQKYDTSPSNFWKVLYNR